MQYAPTTTLYQWSIGPVKLAGGWGLGPKGFLKSADFFLSPRAKGKAKILPSNVCKDLDCNYTPNCLIIGKK